MGFYLGSARLGETRQAAVRALLCESYPVRLRSPRCEEHKNSRNSSCIQSRRQSQVDGQRERGSFVRRGVLHLQCEVYTISHRARCNR